jgi:2-hydroxychromene-2-carboxylate isomerase
VVARIDYFLSPISPWCYLAGLRLEAIAARHGLAIAYRPVDLTALFARTGGLPLAERHESRRAYRLQDLARQARRAGLPITLAPRHWPVNAAPASYAIIAAQAAGGGDVGALCHGLLRACWAEERDIADDATVRACLAAAGFDPALADRGLLLGAETYAANLEEAVARGVFGVPFYITEGDARFWGQDRLDDLALHLEGRL